MELEQPTRPLWELPHKMLNERAAERADRARPIPTLHAPRRDTTPWLTKGLGRMAAARAPAVVGMGDGLESAAQLADRNDGLGSHRHSALAMSGSPEWLA